MHADTQLIAIAVALFLIAGPATLGLTGLIRARQTQRDPPHVTAPGPGLRRNWRLTISSGLLYTLAFNLTFFIQELFLVLPKAFTPGLRPTLFHNNHHWEGDHPLASLFQGTGVVAILFSGCTCALLLKRTSRPATLRLFLLWMTYCGFFEALPQVVIGAIGSESDVGMAMDYLHFGATARTVAALVALTAMPLIGLWLARNLLGFVPEHAQPTTAGGRARFVFLAGTLPALAALLPIIVFRVPREWIEVVLVPVVVTIIGTAWMQAGSWRINTTPTHGDATEVSIARPLGAVLVLLLIFQMVLRPGIAFF